MEHQYQFRLRWAEKQKCWVARVPELSDISAHAAEPAEAVRLAEEEIQLYLAALETNGGK